MRLYQFLHSKFRLLLLYLISEAEASGLLDEAAEKLKSRVKLKLVFSAKAANTGHLNGSTRLRQLMLTDIVKPLFYFLIIASDSFQHHILSLIKDLLYIIQLSNCSFLNVIDYQVYPKSGTYFFKYNLMRGGRFSDNPLSIYSRDTFELTEVMTIRIEIQVQLQVLITPYKA